jgi:hypothetical protein
MASWTARYLQLVSSSMSKSDKRLLNHPDNLSPFSPSTTHRRQNRHCQHSCPTTITIPCFSLHQHLHFSNRRLILPDHIDPTISNNSNNSLCPCMIM